MGRRVVRRGGLFGLFGVLGMLRRHPYLLIWAVALVVVASERGW
jgi:hypothetical protein